MQCKKCGHDTNHKSGICAACSFDIKFGSGEMQPLPIPARSPFKTTKSNQGSKVKKGHTGSVLSQNPYLLDDLELLLNAQISHIFSLVKEGKLKLAAHRINLVQKELTKNEALKNAKHKKHR